MLEPKAALRLATTLRTVPDFPRDQESVDATAEDLIDLSREDSFQPASSVAFVPTLGYEESAKRVRWLVAEIRRTWDRWTGTADMIRLYRSRWPLQREVKTEDNEIKQYGAKPAIQCTVCRDTGVLRPGGRESHEPYQWCECEMGILLHLDIPDWLDILNRPPRVRLRRTTEAEPTNPDYRPITQADIDRAVADNREKRARQELEP